MKKLIVLMIAVCLLTAGCGSVDIETDPESNNVSAGENKEESNSKESQERAEQSIIKESKAKLSEFEYEISGKKVFLKEYNGENEILFIKSKYKNRGKTYKTDLSDFQIGIGNSTVRFLILGNGIKKVDDAIFNSCDVERVYFPKTMKTVYDNTVGFLNPKDGEKIHIYYGGTKDEWKSIFKKYERQTVKEAWNSSDRGEEKGEAVGKSVADKLNEWMGAGYHKEDFEYHCSVSMDDLEKILKNFD